MKRVIRLLLVLLICLSSLSCLVGCVGEIAEITIEPNGSGTINMQFGFTDDALETMVALGTNPNEFQNYKPFEYNGITYYGETISHKFNSVNEFNTLINGNIDEVVNNTGSFTLSKDDMGSFKFTINIDADTIGVDTSEYTDEEIKTLTENMQIFFTIHFPANLTQLTGGRHGVTINGNTLKLDLLKMSETDSYYYMFVTDIPTDFSFTDVSESHWAYSAIHSLANGKLVEGVGDNLFMPEKTLTRAEFYQILARSVGLQVGEENDYWAYKAIESCADFGFILRPFDDINEQNFNEPILREEAVAALTLARNYGNTYTEFKSPIIISSDIPDYNDINPLYQEHILRAFNYGITNGMDSNRTFNPQGLLTRAQGCQLFYNINFCSIPR